MPHVYQKKAKPYSDQDLNKALSSMQKNKLSLRQAAKTFKIDK